MCFLMPPGRQATRPSYTKGLWGQFRGVRPGFGPTPKLALNWQVILPFLLGVGSEGKAASFSPFAQYKAFSQGSARSTEGA